MTEGKPTEWIEVVSGGTSATALILAAMIGAAIVAAIMVYRQSKETP